MRFGNLIATGIDDPKAARTHCSELQPQPDGTLVLKGCLGPFCQREIWGPFADRTRRRRTS
jgi:uncharacterized protein (DUF2147 family)